METSINQSSMLRVGTILHDTYRIEGYLASGGFGNTYVAFNIQFGERCAIKEFFLKGMTQRVDNTSGVSVSNADNISTFMAQKEKFKKEAVRLRKLSSPNIVRVHDLFEANGTAYYVMDFIDGESLRDQLKRLGHPLDEEAVWKILNQVLDALKVVHDQGLFHLDLTSGPASKLALKAVPQHRQQSATPTAMLHESRWSRTWTNLDHGPTSMPSAQQYIPYLPQTSPLCLLTSTMT